MRIVDNRNLFRKDRAAHVVFQKAGAARDRGTGNRTGEMADEAARDARIVDDGNRLRAHLARMEALHRLLAGAPADQRRAFEVLSMTRGRVVVVALHRRAFAGQHRTGDRAGGTRIAAGKAAAGARARDQRDAGTAPAGAGAARIGDARDRERRFFRFGGESRQLLGGGRRGLIFDIEIGPVPRQHGRIGEAAIRVFGRGAGHRHRAFDHRRQRGFREVGGRDVRLPLADEDAQADIAALGTFDWLKLAETP